MSPHSSPLSSGERGPRGLRPEALRKGTDLRLSLVRGPGWLPWRNRVSGGDDLPSGDVVRMARAASGTAGAFLVGGGEPLRRPDLLNLLRDVAALRPDDLGLCTPGLGLTPTVLHALRGAGVRRLTVPFHSVRKDAHDWLVGQPGALKVALRAIRAAVDAGLPVTAEIVVTRPTAPHLAETVEALTHIGVRTLCVRRLTAADVGPADFVPLSPRLSLLAGDLERAAAAALQRRAHLTIRDFPVCVAPRLRRLFARADDEIRISDAGVAPVASGGAACATCPGPPACPGAPADYVSRFGYEEIIDPAPKIARVQESVSEQLSARRAGTMVMGWGGPHRVRCAACADPEGADAPEPTRIVRARLVDAARHRPAVLRLVGAELFAHPSAAALLFDAVRLFPRVECAGEGSAIAGWRDAELTRLKTLARLDMALYGPDAATHDAHCGIAGSFAATVQAIDRLREQTPIAVGTYAIVHDAATARAFAEAWDRGALPGSPRFRLSAQGAALGDMVTYARHLPPGDTRSALLALLPHCLCEAAGIVLDEDGARPDADGAPFGIACGQPVAWRPCGTDPIGEFTRCDTDACAARGCPGTAVGWTRGTRSERWMLNS